MNITITLFHGISGWAAGSACIGAVAALALEVFDWAHARGSVRVRPLRITRIRAGA